MPQLPAVQPPDTGEEIVSMRPGVGSSLPDMPAKDPVLLAWRGAYEMRLLGEEPYIVPRLIPYVMRPGLSGMGERVGDLPTTDKLQLQLQRTNGVIIRHPRLPSYLRRRRVRGEDPSRPVYHYYCQWETPVQSRRGDWTDKHDEDAYVRFLLSLYQIPDLVTLPTAQDIQEMREARGRRVGRHVNGVDERDRLALAAERHLAELEAAAAARLDLAASTSGPLEEEVVSV